MNKTTLLITSEHGGNEIPAEYKHLFNGHAALLQTHRGCDLGIWSLADAFAGDLNAQLYQNQVSRLLVDTNRSLWRRTLFSEVTKDLPKEEKEKILQTYYHPHRDHIFDFVDRAVRDGRRVLHVATHSFTPTLNGRHRNTDIGLLYDPARSNEKRLCRNWKNSLRSVLPDLRVRFNYPYRGKPDGLTAHVRKTHHNDRYVGIELEVNQKHVARDGRFPAELLDKLTRALQDTLATFRWL